MRRSLAVIVASAKDHARKIEASRTLMASTQRTRAVIQSLFSCIRTYGRRTKSLVNWSFTIIDAAIACSRLLGVWSLTACPSMSGVDMVQVHSNACGDYSLGTCGEMAVLIVCARSGGMSKPDGNCHDGYGIVCAGSPIVQNRSR